MVKDKQETEHGLAEIGVGLDELVRRGARQVIQQAIVTLPLFSVSHNQAHYAACRTCSASHVSSNCIGLT